MFMVIKSKISFICNAPNAGKNSFISISRIYYSNEKTVALDYIMNIR